MPASARPSTGPHDGRRSASRHGGGRDQTSFTLCPFTSTLRQAPLARIAVEPSPRNGLRKPSQQMGNRLFTLPNQALGDVVRQLWPDVLMDLALALRGWLELP